MAVLPHPRDSDALKGLARRVHTLEQAMRMNAAAHGLGMSSIDNGNLQVQGGGSIVVNDATGARHVTIGVQPDSSYGLSVTDPTSGAQVPLSQLAFGAQAASNASTFSTTADSTWRTDGTDTLLSVTVTGGRLLVMVSAQQYSSVSACNVLMSWRLTGGTTVTEDPYRALVTSTAGFAAASYSSGSFAYLHTGLPSGTYTITPKYRADKYGTTADTGYIGHRTVVALPF